MTTSATTDMQTGGYVLILGATSAIAQSYARICAAEGAAIVLAGRKAERLSAIAADLRARGATSTAFHAGDLSAVDEIPGLWSEIVAAHGCPSEVLLAYGILRNIASLRSDSAELAAYLTTNFTSAAIWLELVASAMESAGHGRIVVIGSVAGDRGRQSNYLYGAAKAALERQVEGLQHRFALASGKSLSAHLAKPGFVDTPMTDGMEKGGILWASPSAVAAAIRRGVQADRRKFYVPWFWRAIMFIIRNLPAAVLHRTRL